MRAVLCPSSRLMLCGALISWLTSCTADAEITFIDSGQGLGDGNAFALALGDLDRDGDPDLLLIGGLRPAGVWRNDGSGYLSDTGQAFGGTINHGVDLGDLDAVIYQYLHDNVIRFNDGHANFADSSHAFGGDDSSFMTLADFDDDDDVDVFLATRNESCQVWLNDGSGRLQDSGQQLGSTSGWRQVAAADLDGDGDQDVMATNNAYGNLVWLNDGQGHFAAAGSFFGSGSQKLALGDLDGDLDIDACTTHRDYGNEVWVNDGSGSFSGAGTLLGSGPSISVALDDLDDDHDQDAVLGGFADQGMLTRIYFNTTISAAVGAEPGRSALLDLRPREPVQRTTAAAVIFTLPERTAFELRIHDLDGRRAGHTIRARAEAGRHRLVLDTRPLASGVHFCRLTTEAGEWATCRLLLVR